MPRVQWLVHQRTLALMRAWRAYHTAYLRFGTPDFRWYVNASAGSPAPAAAAVPVLQPAVNKASLHGTVRTAATTDAPAQSAIEPLPSPPASPQESDDNPKMVADSRGGSVPPLSELREATSDHLVQLKMLHGHEKMSSGRRAHAAHWLRSQKGLEKVVKEVNRVVKAINSSLS